MRPVNLIPTDQGARGGALRTAPIAYLVVGALALGLGVVTMLVLTNNKIADRQVKIADLSREQQAEQAKAAQLQPFIAFQQTESERIKAIRGIANGRIDWNRIMQELSRILPDDVRLDSLTAAAGGSDVTTGQTAGPSLDMDGCALGHEGVAGFIAALQDIDGVTGVDLQTSEKADSDSAGTQATSSTGTSETCPSSAGVAKFQLTVSLKGPTAAVASTAPPVAAAPATSTTPAPTDTTQATPASSPVAAPGGGA